MKTLPMETPPIHSPMDIRYDRNRGLGAEHAISNPSMPPSSDIGAGFVTSGSAAELGNAAPPDFPESTVSTATRPHPAFYPVEGAPPTLTGTGTPAGQEPFETVSEGAPPADPAGMGETSSLAQAAGQTPLLGLPPSDFGQTRDDDPPPLSMLTEASAAFDPLLAVGEAAPPPESQLNAMTTQTLEAPNPKTVAADTPSTSSTPAAKKRRGTASPSRKGSGGRTSKGK